MRRQAVLALLSTTFCLACDDGSSYALGPLQLGTAVEPAFAVMLRQDEDSALGLLDASGAVIRDSYLHSTQKLAGAMLEDAWSIPSNPELDGVLSVLDGQPIERLLRIDYFNGEILSEVSLRGAGKISLGVRDYLYIDEKQAWLTRYEPNLDEKAKGLELGDDLVLLQPGTGKLVKRIDLSSLYEDVTYLNEKGDELTARAYARPSRLVGLAGGYAYVGLDRLTADDDGAAAGAGLILDAAKAKVSIVEIEGMKRCADVVPVSGKDDAVIVACGGAPLSVDETRGFAYVELEKGKAEVKHTFRFESDKSPFAFSPISLGGTRFAIGLRTEDEDVLFVVDFASQKTVELDRFKRNAFGSVGAFQPALKLLMLPDTNRNRILRFVVDSKGAKADGSIALDSDLTVQAVLALKRF
jgi:hypothetical protein